MNTTDIVCDCTHPIHAHCTGKPNCRGAMLMSCAVERIRADERASLADQPNTPATDEEISNAIHDAGLLDTKGSRKDMARVLHNFLGLRKIRAPAAAPKTNRDQTVAVDPDYFWRSMCDCPIGVKVQLLGAGGVAAYGNYIRGDGFWHGWAPLPKERKTL